MAGFVGTEEAQAQWIEENVEGWKSLVNIMSGVAYKHLQTAFAVLHKSLYKELAFVQRVTPYTGKAFQPVDDVLQ